MNNFSNSFTGQWKPVFSYILRSQYYSNKSAEEIMRFRLNCITTPNFNLKKAEIFQVTTTAVWASTSCS